MTSAHDPFNRAGRAAVRAVEDIKVESGIPYSPRRRTGPWVSLALRMKPGDSVAVTRAQSESLRSAMRELGFKARKRTEEDGSVRMWRIEWLSGFPCGFLHCRV